MFEDVDDNWQYLKDALRLQNKHLTSFLNQVAEISSKRWCCLFSKLSEHVEEHLVKRNIPHIIS